MLVSIVLTLLSLILSLLLLENPLVTSRMMNLGKIASKMVVLLVLFVFPMVPPLDLRLVKSIVLLLLVTGTLVGLGAGLPSWIWMMPPVMAQIVATRILLRREDLWISWISWFYVCFS